MNISAILFSMGFLLLSACLTGAIVRFVLGWALRNGVIDVPNERSSHERPTPRGGGLGIVAAVSFLSLIAIGLSRASGIDLGMSAWRLTAALGGGILVAGVSWLDDIRHGIHVLLRIAVHLAAAGVAVTALGGWGKIELPWVIISIPGWAGFGLAVLWIVGLINAYNFMDGIDGIAGGQAVTASLGWLAVGLMAGSPVLSAGGALLLGASVGFLFFNWHPARIFMGDVGSAFLGYSFAILPLLAAQALEPAVVMRLPVAGLLFVGPFVVDASATFIRRLARGEDLYKAHRSHFYQRLVIAGASHSRVSALYVALGLLGGLAGTAYLFVLSRGFAASMVLLALLVTLGIPCAWVSMGGRQGKIFSAK